MAKHQLGILFVHGIGEQPEGDTLLAFGEPVLNWIKRWLSRREKGATRGSIGVMNATLTPSKLNRSLPPHAEVQLCLEGAREAHTFSWLMAESWWGGEVQRPAFGKLAGWMLTVGTWTILSHATKWAHARETKAARIIIEVFALALWLPLALSLQISVLLLSLLAPLPIPSLRKALSNVLLAITGVLGDSYVLLESDLQRSAIVNKTRDALLWLGMQCQSVIVIAHSQGAALAHHALRDSEPRNVSLLLTFGSGLGKLEELSRASEATGRAKLTARAVPLMFLFAALIGYITVYEDWDHLNALGIFLAGFLILVAVAAVLVSARNHWDTFGEWARSLSLKSTRPNLKWIDIYASHDLVPNGALAPSDVGIDGLESKSVVNLRSWLWDHTTYWDNRCEFVPQVVRAIANVANLDLFPPANVEELEQTAATHRRNVWWLVATRWATWLSVILLFWLFWDLLLVQGSEIFADLKDFGSRFDSVLQSLKAAREIVFPFLSNETVVETSLGMLGAVIPLLLIAAWRYAYRFLWRWWDSVAVERLFRPGFMSSRVDRAVVDFFIVAAGFFPLLAVCVWPFVQHASIGHILGETFLMLYSIGFLTALGRFSIKSPTLFARIWRGDPGARAELKEELTAIGMMSLAGGVIYMFAFPKLYDFLFAHLWFKVTLKIMGYGVLLSWLFLVLVRWHKGLLARVEKIAQQKVAQYIAVVGPVAIALVIATWTSVALLERPQWSTEPLEGVFGVLMITGIWYGIGLGLGGGIVWLINRSRQKSATT